MSKKSVMTRLKCEQIVIKKIEHNNFEKLSKEKKIMQEENL